LRTRGLVRIKQERLETLLTYLINVAEMTEFIHPISRHSYKKKLQRERERERERHNRTGERTR